DESMLTGESVPVPKEKGDEVIGGSINQESTITLRVLKLGDDSYLNQVVKMVEEAQNSRSRTQDLANKAAKYLFYIALSAGIITFTVWAIITRDIGYALERAVTVMVITCPHALGLAAPLVVARSTSIAAKSGLLIKDRAHFEQGRKINAIVFDKTGTLTEGKFEVTDIVAFSDFTETDLLTFAGSLESQSSHPLSKGLMKVIEERDIKTKEITSFESMTGKGIKGDLDGKTVMVISPNYLDELGYDYETDTYKEVATTGKTISFVVHDETVIGFYALTDVIRESAKKAIDKLKSLDIIPIMVTGDNQKVADWVGDELGIEHIYAEVLPDEKANILKEIQKEYGMVAMTGDGINDAPALVSADLGIAVGAGTDVAIESADIILVNSDPLDIVAVLTLAKKTYRKLKQNLWWAAGYNILAIPLAAGVLAFAGIILSPAVGAILMSMSTVIVAINAQLLRQP
ncbi:MAG: heavy metal translocating P-type ATPase, partial [Candidatus Izimaplasma sp.]|nr:heavy metal translocating P-type ATPase [Candidatus Izimaplasma bacterium]